MLIQVILDVSREDWASHCKGWHSISSLRQWNSKPELQRGSFFYLIHLSLKKNKPNPSCVWCVRMWTCVHIGVSGTMMHRWSQRTAWGVVLMVHLVWESLSSAAVQSGDRELVHITLTVGPWGSQMHYCFRHYIGSRDSNSGPPSGIASALLTDFVK